MAAVALESIVQQLTESGIISLGQLENFIPPKAEPKSVEELVGQLVQENHLTRFQAAQVAAGNANTLILGEYTILDKIGAGGMGQVFKALHRRMERTVAIKMLPPAMTHDAAALTRFHREVVAAAKLQHTNIVTAYDAGQANTAHFLVMEYIEGNDLSAIVKNKGPFPVAKAVNYILQAARGLEYAHKKGVVHRDIKPSNMLLDPEGTVKVLDMGLARIESHDATQAELTGTGDVMGTVDYMAPEQGMSTKDADARADIYSLGCSLYYLLVGKAVYGGETVAAKLLAHHNNPIPALQSECPAVSEQLDAVFKKMVAKRIEDRYQKMTEVVLDLERLDGNSGTASDPFAATAAMDSGPLAAIKNTVDVPTKRVGPTNAGGDKRQPWKNKKVVAGAAGFLCLLLGVIVIVRGKDNKKMVHIDAPNETKVTIPAGGSVQVFEDSGANTIGHAPPLAVAPFDAKQARAHQEAWAKHLGIEVETTNSVGQKMILIPPGEFLMGGTDQQMEEAIKVDYGIEVDQVTKEHFRHAERPQHKVVITKPFLISATEVTVGHFKKFSAQGFITEAERSAKDGNTQTYLNLGYDLTDDYPATAITWNDAVAYCKWLSDQERRNYRLPNEAEWEYACRAGTTTQYSFGDDHNELPKYGWHSTNAAGHLHPVGALLPNNFGLFDMHGNLWEWCGDYWDERWYVKSLLNNPAGPSTGIGRVIRGGNWYYNGFYCRSTFRSFLGPSPPPDASNGFRCVAELSLPLVTAPTSSADSFKLFMHDPAFPQWMKDVQAMSAEEQINAVRKKLMELNPGFDGVLTDSKGTGTPKIDGGVVSEVGFDSEFVADISPVRALTGLKVLNCSSKFGTRLGKVHDLSPLREMKLEELICADTNASDLSPLKGLPLTSLICYQSKVSDLSPLEGLPLKILWIGATDVDNLRPIQGMPLESLACNSTKISDLSPISGMELTFLCITPQEITKGLEAVREMKTLSRIEGDFGKSWTVEEFWRKYDNGEFSK